MFTLASYPLALQFAYPYLVWLMGKNGLARLGGFVCTAAAAPAYQDCERAHMRAQLMRSSYQLYDTEF
jgi:hypothetical protein